MLVSFQIITCLLLLLAPILSMAGQHALLIGVSDFSDPRIPDLEGPVNDVNALREVLVSNWQFRDNNITVLTNERATEQAILSAIDKLHQTTEAGDDVIVYYSGHGTSASDPDFGAYLNLPDGTGAIVASDFDPDKLNRSSLSQPVNDGLIVGSFDIRPRLQKLDSSRNVLVVFDACFSGNAVREAPSAYKPSRKRHIDLSEWIVSSVDMSTSSPADGSTDRAANRIFDTSASRTDSTSSSTTRSLAPDEYDEFIYDNVVYFGAAAENQYAVDLSAAEIAAGLVSTIDGKPHGGFTDALLRVLWETSEYTSELSFAGLFNRTINQFNSWCKSCGHTPVSLPTASNPDHEQLDRIILRSTGDQQNTDDYNTASEPALDDTLIIDSEPGNDTLLALKSALPLLIKTRGGSVARSSPDIVFKSVEGYLNVHGSDGSLITQLLADVSADEMLRWLTGRHWLKGRLARDNHNNRGNLKVSFAHPLADNRVTEGEMISFSVLSSKKARLVALVIDGNSDLSLLYPVNPSERASMLLPNNSLRIPEANEPQIQVRPPWGTDTVMFYSLETEHSLDPLLSELANLRSIPLSHPAWLAFESVLDESDSDYSTALIRVVAVPSSQARSTQ